MLFMLPKIWQILCILLYLLYCISYWYPALIAMEGCHKMWLNAFLLYVVKHKNIRQELLFICKVCSYLGLLVSITYYIHIKLHTWYISYVNFSIRFNHITIENIKFNLPNVVNLTSWTTGQFLVMSRKVISHLYSPSSEVLIFSILNLASEVSDSICRWPLQKKLNEIL